MTLVDFFACRACASVFANCENLSTPCLMLATRVSFCKLDRSDMVLVLWDEMPREKRSWGVALGMTPLGVRKKAAADKGSLANHFYNPFMKSEAGLALE